MNVSYPMIISIDVEDWQQSTWDRSLPITKISFENTARLLDILSEQNIKTTMFILGKFAEKYPEMVRRIDSYGHEISCHGHNHNEIFNQTKKQFKNDVYRSKSYLEDLIGKLVLGYRAPDFSITNDSLWALEILSELGFKYDSSIFPIKHNRYGIHDWPTDIRNVQLNNNNSILEFPLSTINIKSINLPISGGGYFRLLPISIFSLAAKSILKRRPFIFYCHPYEINPSELNNNDLEIPLLYKLHQGLGRRFIEKRLISIFKKFSTCRFSDYIKNNDLTNIRNYKIS